MQKVSQDQVIDFIYQDDDLKESGIAEAIFKDEKLEEMFFDFLSLKTDLDHIHAKPSDRTIDKILEYSRSFNSNTSSES